MISTMCPRTEARSAVTILKTVLPGTPDPEEVYRTLVPERRAEGVLLESGDVAEGRPVKSLVIHRAAVKIEARGPTVSMAAKSAQGAAVIEVLGAHVREASVVRPNTERAEFTFAFPRDEPEETRRLFAPNVLEALRAVLRLRVRGLDPAEAVMIAGVFAYDLVEQFEPLPEADSDPLSFPDFVFWLPERVVRIDHDLKSTSVFEHIFGDPDDPETREKLQAAERRLAETERRLAEVRPLSVRRPGAPRSGIRAMCRPDTSDEDFAAVVRRMKEAVSAGEVFQVVPSRVFRLPCSNVRGAYAELRRLNPSPYMFLLEDERFTLFGASPEAAIEVETDGPRRILRISPIAGTRPRGRRQDGTIDPETDARVEAELRLDEKENAEHMMLVDLARNDVARVCKPGSRYVAELLTVVRYAHVMHLVSEVQGELRKDIDALHAYQATANMGTLVGAPKVRAAQLLREAEGVRRGPYGGAVAVFFGDGSLDSAIVIRTALVKDGVAQVRAGAGVVFDSSPRAEADETWHKAHSVCEAIHRAEETR